jgi:hypothetical protein
VVYEIIVKKLKTRHLLKLETSAPTTTEGDVTTSETTTEEATAPVDAATVV